MTLGPPLGTGDDDGDGKAELAGDESTVTAVETMDVPSVALVVLVTSMVVELTRLEVL